MTSARARRFFVIAWLAGACVADGRSSDQTGSGGATADAAGSAGEAASSAGGSTEAGAGSGGSGGVTPAASDAAIESNPGADASKPEASVPTEPAPSTGFQEIPLYPGNAPNFVANAPRETTNAAGQIMNISVPTLRRYPFDESKATGTAFVVFPGGGYNELEFEANVAAMSRRLGPLGIAIFGLKYRVAGGTQNAPRDALLDAKRAIRLVRSKAAAWGLAADRIGVISYSAGSHVAMNLVAGFDRGDPAAADTLERLSSRPDFVASMCTWNFGNATSPFKFTADAPPVFLCHAQDDTVAPIALAFAIEQQLKNLGVLEHLEVYPSGGHTAFRVGEPKATGRDWPDKFLPWLRDNHLTP
jgi:acetyl esterase/lipase